MLRYTYTDCLLYLSVQWLCSILDTWEISFHCERDKRFCCCPQTRDQLRRPHSLLPRKYQQQQRLLPSQWPGHEAKWSAPSIAQVKNAWSFTSTYLHTNTERCSVTIPLSLKNTTTKIHFCAMSWQNCPTPTSFSLMFLWMLYYCWISGN